MAPTADTSEKRGGAGTVVEQAQTHDTIAAMKEKEEGIFHVGGTDSSISSQQEHRQHLAVDGSVLVPQPSTSPDDPLNWSWWKKHRVFLALLPGSLLSDWVLSWGTAVFEAQAPDWGMSVVDAAQSVSPGIFMQGPGGLVAVPLCQRYGRLPVLFWSQLLALAATIGAMLAPTYASFTAFRTLQGFFGAPPQVIGMSIIHDMFFFHERARKINIWAATFLIGPYLGPQISSLLLLKLGWRPNFGVLAGFYAWSLCMIIFLGDETLFERQGLERREVNAPVQGSRKPFSPSHHVALLTGIEGFRNRHGRPGIWTVFRHLFSLLARPYLCLLCVGFALPILMWTIGMVSTVSQFVLPPAEAGGYGFTYVALAMLYFAPMIGTVLAEGWGHWFNDFLARRYMGRYSLECRLTAVYPSVLIGIIGLVLYGQTLEHHLSWAGLAVGWAMLTFCTLATMTAISAYALDCFPHHAALASAWLNFWRVMGGFSTLYFQLQWVQLDGPGVAFGCQAAVIAGSAFAVLAAQVWGRRWRATFPAPAAEN